MRRTLVLGCLVVLTGCSGPDRYVDGPLRELVEQPLPQLNTALARTASLSVASWGSEAGYVLCDMNASASGKLQRTALPQAGAAELDSLLKLDAPYSDDNTRAAFEAIARLTHPGENTEVQQTDGHAHASAASMKAGNKALEVDGDGDAEEAYDDAREWLLERSGAVGSGAPEGTHLAVFLLELHETRDDGDESRSRVAVLLVHVDKDGHATSVLRGSDLASCDDDCDEIELKSSMKELDPDDAHDDVQEDVLDDDALENLAESGFREPNGAFAYILVQHALAELAQRLAGGGWGDEPVKAGEDDDDDKPELTGDCAPVDPAMLSGSSVPDQVWGVAKGRRACVVRLDGTVVQGEIKETDGDTITVVQSNDEEVEVKKTETAEVRVEQ